MAGLVSRVDALEQCILPEGTSPASTAILLRVQHLEDLCLGERAEGALLARLQQLEEICFGQAGAQVGAAPAAPAAAGFIAHSRSPAPVPIGQGASQWPAQAVHQVVHQAAPVAAAHADGGRIFVGDLPPDVEAEELHVTFGAFGGVQDVHVMRGKSTSGRSCAFVVLDTWQAGDKAISALSGTCSLREGDQPMIVNWPKNGRPGSAEPARPPVGSSGGSGYGSVPVPPRVPARPPPVGGSISAGGSVTKLFVGNLPMEVQPDALQDLFGTYGVVTNIHLMAGKSASGQSCAFVEYSTASEAETAIYHLHEKYETLPGQGQIIVKYAKNGGQRGAPY